jgi:class 3 adenylate cyclase
MTSKEILAEINTIFSTKWSTRDGRQVPEAEDIRLGNDAVSIDGTVLYADMADSTGLVNNFKDWFAAEVYKAYLVSACRIIRYNGGEITAFDGDRVMAVFMGNRKNTLAAKTALQINFIVKEINSVIKSSFQNTAYQLFQTVGIDTSKLFVAKTGIRNANDLVWVGRAANYAAKLCTLSDTDYPTHITESVYSALAEEAKFGGNPRRVMWEKRMWSKRGIVVYRSNWLWPF